MDSWLIGLTFCVIFVLFLWIGVRMGRVAPVRFEGSVALVTGAGGGLGRQLACDLARRGAQLVLWDIHEGRLKGTVEAVKEAAGSEYILASEVVDVTDQEDSFAAADRFVDILPPTCPILLFNNAGGSHSLSRPFSVLPSPPFLIIPSALSTAGIVLGYSMIEQPDGGVERLFEVNVLSHFRLIRRLLPVMLEPAHEGSRVIATSSIMSLLGTARISAYCSSKWAVTGMMESLRLELQSQNVTSVATLTVCPYMITTDMFTGALEDGSLWWVRLLFPLLHADRVSRDILDALEAGRTMLVIPWTTELFGRVLRLLPMGYQDLVLGIMGGWFGMDTFRAQGIQRSFHEKDERAQEEGAGNTASGQAREGEGGAASSLRRRSRAKMG